MDNERLKFLKEELNRLLNTDLKIIAKKRNYDEQIEKLFINNKISKKDKDIKLNKVSDKYYEARLKIGSARIEIHDQIKLIIGLPKTTKSVDDSFLDNIE